MTSFQNPFTASFGVPSAATYVGREEELAQFRQGLDDRPGSINRAILISGPRGVGKTSLQVEMLGRAKQAGWVTSAVTAGPGLAERILDKATLAAEHLLPPEPKRLLTGISVAGFGLTSDAVPATSPSWWRRISRLLDVLEEHGTGLVIAIDEVHREEAELRPLFQQYQELVNERRNVAIVLAGLPDATEGLLTEYALTFVQRARRMVLGRIPLPQLTETYLAAIQSEGKGIDAVTAMHAARESEGFPYLFQLVGYFSWQLASAEPKVTSANVDAAIPLATELAGQNLYELEMRGLTSREREFLTALLADGEPSQVSAIAQRLKTSTNNVNYYRARLIARGLVEPAGRGRLRLASGFLRRYLAEHLMDGNLLN